MAKIVNKSQIAKYLTCPYCFTKSSLSSISGGFKCKKCKRQYKYNNKIIDFIKPNDLDKDAKRELKGNTFKLSKKNIDHYAKKDEWSNYYNHYVNKKISALEKYLSEIKFNALASLGSGPGFEIKELLKRMPIDLVLSSDIAESATRVVPESLKTFDTDLILFTSDLNHSPVIPNKKMPILIYEALHHTGMLSTIEDLFQKKYKNILFVEPATNFLVKILARLGLAQRIEYSGLLPAFVDLYKLKLLARHYGYKVKITTLWEIPEDFFRKICKKEGALQHTLLYLIDMFSDIGNLFDFGSFSIVSLEKI